MLELHSCTELDIVGLADASSLPKACVAQVGVDQGVAVVVECVEELSVELPAEMISDLEALHRCKIFREHREAGQVAIGGSSVAEGKCCRLCEGRRINTTADARDIRACRHVRCRIDAGNLIGTKDAAEDG